ncbi:MAG TPA: hypothetical protein VIY47_02915 [Ignavibacteriaceae bacterium]
MRFRDLVARDAYNDIVRDLSYPDKKDSKGLGGKSVPRGQSEKTPTGIKHSSNSTNPNRQQFEATGDEKFDKMLGKITAPSDTQKYNQMMGGILDPTLSQTRKSESFLEAGDRLVDDLEEVILRWPDRHKDLIAQQYDENPDYVGDWLANETKISIDTLSTLRSIIKDLGGLDILLFFAFSPDEFYDYIRKPWARYKDLNK